MTEPKPLRIKEFRASNFKRLKVVDIRPDGSLVQITGKNGNGKTSVLDGIWVALAGISAAPPVLIRKGQEKASLRLDMGEIIVTRTFTAKESGGYTNTVKVESDQGAKFTSPQAVLDALVGQLSFDPLAFTRMKPKEQFEALKVLVPGIDFADIAKRRKDAFEARTGKKGRLDDLRAQAEGITLPPGKLPVAVDVATLEAQLAKAGDHNTLVERRKAGRTDMERRIKETESTIADLEEHLADAKGRLETMTSQLAKAEPLPEPIDTAKVQADLQTARTTNLVVARVAQRAELEKQATTTEAEVEGLTATIKACDDERTAAVTKAKMPVEGLGFGDDEVLLNGVPLEQASDAEQLRASIAIAGAMNPRLRVIRVRDGSLLDDDGLKLLEQYAQDHDLQIWLERVDSSGTIGFVLEDGQLKGDALIVDEPAEDEGELV
jgi:hypothetical protein